MVQAISAERTLILPEYSGLAGGTLWPLTWPAKDPRDQDMDFSLDISGWLREIEDNAATVDAVWEPNNPGDSFLLSAVWVYNSVVTVLASGGTPWFIYGVQLIVTSQILQQVLSRTISLPVVPLYSPGLSATSGMVSGVMLT